MPWHAQHPLLPSSPLTVPLPSFTVPRYTWLADGFQAVVQTTPAGYVSLGSFALVSLGLHQAYSHTSHAPREGCRETAAAQLPDLPAGHRMLVADIYSFDLLERYHALPPIARQCSLPVVADSNRCCARHEDCRFPHQCRLHCLSCLGRNSSAEHEGPAQAHQQLSYCDWHDPCVRHHQFTSLWLWRHSNPKEQLPGTKQQREWSISTYHKVLHIVISVTLIQVLERAVWQGTRSVHFIKRGLNEA